MEASKFIDRLTDDDLMDFASRLNLTFKSFEYDVSGELLKLVLYSEQQDKIVEFYISDYTCIIANSHYRNLDKSTTNIWRNFLYARFGVEYNSELCHYLSTSHNNSYTK